MDKTSEAYTIPQARRLPVEGTTRSDYVPQLGLIAEEITLRTE